MNEKWISGCLVVFGFAIVVLAIWSAFNMMQSQREIGYSIMKIQALDSIAEKYDTCLTICDRNYLGTNFSVEDKKNHDSCYNYCLDIADIELKHFDEVWK